jgi:hypothetical protein
VLPSWEMRWFSHIVTASPPRPSAMSKLPTTMSRSPSASEIGDVERGMPRRADLERVSLETATRLLFQPDQRWQLALVDGGSQRHPRARHDVEIPVTVEVGCLRTARARQLCQRVLDEREPASVLEPLNTVVRFDSPSVECVAMVSSTSRSWSPSRSTSSMPEHPQSGCGAV